jgi:mRNA interferase MazF
MKRGDLDLAAPSRRRSPQETAGHDRSQPLDLVDSLFPTVVCAPVLTRGHGLETEVSVGPEEGLKHPSWIGCDGLVSIPKSRLTDFVGSLSPSKLSRLSQALRIALDI